MWQRAGWFCVGIVSVFTLGAGVAVADPPFRVARLSVADGSVSYLPGDSEEWRPATINYPLTSGDTLWSDRGSRAELTIGSTAIRMGSETSAGFLTLDDRTVQIRMTQGTLQVRLRRLDRDQVFEVDTPNGAISLLQPGDYRIDAFPENSGSLIAVRMGEAEITGGGTAFPVRGGETARVYGTGPMQYDLVATAPPDGWDQWCMDRDRYEDSAVQQVAQYVGPEMIGGEDLAPHGVWSQSPDYGPVWTPNVNVGWAPYRYGHWVFIVPWGWTWVDDAPWGFAPFHYGRWVQLNGVWVWVPGARVARPVYAPALVVFLGGPRFNLSVSVGGGVGWFPLGPREVYRPSYRTSETYVRNINITHVTNITNVTNVTNVRYINREAGTTAVARDVFVSQRAVHRDQMRVSAQDLQHAEVGTAPAGVTPPRSFGRGDRNVAQPPRGLVDRPVVVRNAPPTGSDSVRPTVRPVEALVRQAPPVTEHPRRVEPPSTDRNRRFGNNERPPQQQLPSERPGPADLGNPAPRVWPDRPPSARESSVNPAPQPVPQMERSRPLDHTAQPVERVRPSREDRPAVMPPREERPRVERPAAPLQREERPRIERPAASPERVQERREQRQEQRRESKPEPKNDDKKGKDR